MGALITTGALAGVYALLAVGIVLVYRTSRVLNLAQGEFAVLTGYLVALLVAVGLPPVIGILAAVVVGAVLGVVSYVLLMRRLVGHPAYVGLLVTVGIAIVLQGMMVVAFGGRSERLQLVTGTYRIGSDVVSAADVATSLVSWLVLGAFFLVHSRTQAGLRMRAIAEDALLAAQRGINIDRVVCATWAMAVAFAGLAGVLQGSRGVLAIPVAYVGIKAVIAALIGGMDSLTGAVLGAVLVAVAEYASIRWGAAQFADLAPVLLLLAILIARPWGLFGTVEEIERV